MIIPSYNLKDTKVAKYSKSPRTKKTPSRKKSELTVANKKVEKSPTRVSFPGSSKQMDTVAVSGDYMQK